VLTFIFLVELLGGFVTFREGREVEVEDSSREVWIGFFPSKFRSSEFGTVDTSNGQVRLCHGLLDNNAKQSNKSIRGRVTCRSGSNTEGSGLRTSSASSTAPRCQKGFRVAVHSTGSCSCQLVQLLPFGFRFRNPDKRKQGPVHFEGRR
jgi:hypothetical protein